MSCRNRTATAARDGTDSENVGVSFTNGDFAMKVSGTHAPFFSADCWLGVIPGIEDRRVSAIVLIFRPSVRRHAVLAGRGRRRGRGRLGKEKVPRVASPQNSMGTKSSDKIARSPTPPDTDDEGGDIEWPVHGIVGEDVDVFGISRSVVKQKRY